VNQFPAVLDAIVVVVGESKTREKDIRGKTQVAADKICSGRLERDKAAVGGNGRAAYRQVRHLAGGTLAHQTDGF
jgi:hypothetical protein